MVATFITFALALSASVAGPPADRHFVDVAAALEATTTIVYPAEGLPVEETVATFIRDVLSRRATVVARRSFAFGPPGAASEIRVAVFQPGRDMLPAAASSVPEDMEWAFVQFDVDGSGSLIVSTPHLLYAMFNQVQEKWLHDDVRSFAEGRLITSTFPWLVGEDGFYGHRRRLSRNYDAEQNIRELARIGASHVIVNALPQPYSLETGPEGEVYYRFYQYGPDLDQFVSTRLNAGTYPPEYLEANLNFLREQVALVVKYGLTPGLRAINPRSVPESLLEKYPFLRGARVDHPFRSYRPRYTLTTAHPVVRWHYAELMKKLLEAVPELGFMVTLINDSGSGFEYTASLYAGRNGGPYVVREWRPDDEVARAAAANVVRYYQLLRDAAHEVNPAFRIIAGLKNIPDESAVILEGFGDGLDRRVGEQSATEEALRARGSLLQTDVSARGSAYVLGVPSPWKTYDGLMASTMAGHDRLSVGVSPRSLAPFDVNRSVVEAVQLGGVDDIDTVIARAAIGWVGSHRSSELVSLWRATDEAVRAAPTVPLYGGSGFTWYRFWDRPFVPDIGRIPEEERAYYEDYLLTVFNNPHNVDLQADALWDILSIEECTTLIVRFDTELQPRLDNAIHLAAIAIDETSSEDNARRVFVDLHDRLRAYRAYNVTLRNICAWIVGVHGYLQAETDDERVKWRAVVDEMVSLELTNATALLALWEESDVDFMPIYASGENGHDYGPNFGDNLRRKIDLMERYGDVVPYIDPDYMWRVPEGFPISHDEFGDY